MVGGESRLRPGSGPTVTEMTRLGSNQSLIFFEWHGQSFVHMLEISVNTCKINNISLSCAGVVHRCHGKFTSSVGTLIRELSTLVC